MLSETAIEAGKDYFVKQMSKARRKRTCHSRREMWLDVIAQ